MTKGTLAGIAWRYLRHRLPHSAIKAVAAISIAGVAVATAAILCVLSVFNGFKEVLTERDDLITPDVVITPAKGKTILNGDSLANAIPGMRGVAEATPMVEDQALAIFNMQEMPVMLRGIDFSAFRKITGIDSLIIAGEKIYSDPLAIDPPSGLLSPGVASRLGSYSSDDRIFLFAPRREGRINLANPAMSFFTDSITATSVFESRRSEIDINTVYVPLELARGLFQYDTEATSIIAKCAPGIESAHTAEMLRKALGNAYEVKDRVESQEINFRMVNIEKWITALLLFFILIIASFNIISTMTMIVIEKNRSIKVFRALGMTSGKIGRIFAWESLYITLAGALSGLAIGIILCLLQEHFGFIKISGDATRMILQDYPVRLLARDILPVAGAVLLTGFFTSLTAASFARSRISGKRR